MLTMIKTKFSHIFLGVMLILASCHGNEKKAYTYILFEFNTVSEQIDTVVQTLYAKDDDSAYKLAYNEYCTSEATYSKELKNGTDFSKLEHRPERFVILNENGDFLEFSDEIVLWDIKNTAYQYVFGVEPFDIGSSPLGKTRQHNNSTDYRKNQSSAGTWKDRMQTDEYEKSLAREVYLERIGMKDAAKIERNKRNEYLRGGGYDSKDGGKQVHYNGSAQQARDLQAIDEYMKEHPEFK